MGVVEQTTVGKKPMTEEVGEEAHPVGEKPMAEEGGRETLSRLCVQQDKEVATVVGHHGQGTPHQLLRSLVVSGRLRQCLLPVQRWYLPTTTDKR